MSLRTNVRHRSRASWLAPAALALLAATAAAGEARAQTITYVATQLTAPYAPLTAGANVVLAPGTSFGDQSVLVPIGFTFTYYGQPYDYVEVGENGVLGFRTDCNRGCGWDEFCDFFGTNMCMRGNMPSGDFEGLPSPGTPNRLLAPFWDDLMVDGTAPASAVQYRLLGAAPNRELVVEWRNMRHMSFRFPPSARVSFQVRLRETSNVIRFAYGPYTQGPDNLEWSGRVGLENDDGNEGVIPLACAQNQGVCDWTVLVGLNNQVIEIGVPNVPELTGAVTPLLGGEPGGTVALEARIDNLGPQPAAAPFTVGFYLSTDAVISPGLDTLLATVTIDALDAASSVTATASAVLPAVLPGYYTLGAYVDTTNAIAEATEANNTIVAALPFLLGADLEAQLQVLPPPLAPGGSGDVVFQVLNRSAEVLGMHWRLWLSTDTVLDGSDPLLAEGDADFAAGGVTEVVAHAAVDGGVIPGLYTLIAEVDPSDLLAEVDELNNQALGAPWSVRTRTRPGSPSPTGRCAGRSPARAPRCRSPSPSRTGARPSPRSIGSCTSRPTACSTAGTRGSPPAPPRSPRATRSGSRAARSSPSSPPARTGSSPSWTRATSSPRSTRATTSRW